MIRGFETLGVQKVEKQISNPKILKPRQIWGLVSAVLQFEKIELVPLLTFQHPQNVTYPRASVSSDYELHEKLHIVAIQM